MDGMGLPARASARLRWWFHSHEGARNHVRHLSPPGIAFSAIHPCASCRDTCRREGLPMNPVVASRAKHEQLSTALSEVSWQVQQGCGEVAAMARMALAWLETPRRPRDLEVLASTLQAIRYTAERLGETVEYEAECVECAHEDPAMLRRRAAALACAAGSAAGLTG
ncbi:hypothetical protein FQR65_LT20175 [Abscondita terminalis]|nr:hypothetical protein FQR65_LT20175 [Abscondita terminalis]